MAKDQNQVTLQITIPPSTKTATSQQWQGPVDNPSRFGQCLFHGITMNNIKQWLVNVHNAPLSLAIVENAPSSLLSVLLCILKCSAHVEMNSKADHFELRHD
jgi:hypothetical protein